MNAHIRYIFISLLLIHQFFAYAVDLNRSGFTMNSVHWSDSVLQSMTLQQKIGQLFMLDAYSNRSDAANVKFEEIIKQYQPGGLIFFQGSRVKQLELISEWNQVSAVPLMIGMDAEWGTSMRLSDELWFPKAMQLGAITDSRVVEAIGKAIGEQCSYAGVNMNFAPVLDVNSNPFNPVINYRSFGENPQRVADNAYAFFKGMQANGVLGIGKHFPGHGNTMVDSHSALPVLNLGKYFLENELYPFREAAKLGLSGIMTGHLSVPAFDSTGTPASLSSIIIDSIIKKQWHYKGLIVSDALNMQAVNGAYDKIYLKAFLAGNDILLFPLNIKKAYSEIEEGISSGIVSISDLNARVFKILQYKYLLRLNILPKPNKFDSIHAEIAISEAVNHSLTLIKNKARTIPLTNMSNKTLVLSVDGMRNDEFYRTIQMYGDFDWISLRDKTGNVSAEVAEVLKYDRIILAIHGSLSNMKSNYGLSEEVQEAVAFIPENKELIGVLFGNPYSLIKTDKSFLEKFDAFLIAYENHPKVQRASAQLLCGGIPARGTLPVSISEDYPEGTGIRTYKNRLGFSLPDLEGLREDGLVKIDSIVQGAIEDGAMPGCQVLVARNGNVVFHKQYGSHTYTSANKVKWNDVYDIASITKAICTTPLIMKLHEEGKLDMEQRLGDFDNISNDEFKKNIRIKELLLHQSGLQSFIPFYLYVLDEGKLKDGLFSNRKSSLFSIPVGTGIFANKKVTYKKSWVKKTLSDTHPFYVTPSMYLFEGVKDSIFTWIDTSMVDSSKLYRYSDLNFYYLKKITEFISGKSIDQYSNDLFYKPLGMNYTLFNPTKKFDVEVIPPTENDLLFRRGLVHGTVHDQSAAMQNGIGGHAGLFANAMDLAKFSQMLLQGGRYGGSDYFNWKTVDYFTNSGNSENRRALGFDKPEPDTTKISPVCPSASLMSYGHTGFTGTMMWIDPAYDLVYVFLSNRIYPDADNRKLIDNNIRTEIQETIYKSMYHGFH